MPVLQGGPKKVTHMHASSAPSAQMQCICTWTKALVTCHSEPAQGTPPFAGCSNVLMW
jgi:hypothetical protein